MTRKPYDQTMYLNYKHDKCEAWTAKIKQTMPQTNRTQAHRAERMMVMRTNKDDGEIIIMSRRRGVEEVEKKFIY